MFLCFEKRKKYFRIAINVDGNTHSRIIAEIFELYNEFGVH